MIRKVFDKIKQTSVGKKISSDVAYRTSLLAGWSLCINLIYAVMNGVLGIVNKSLWFITLFAYYLILSAMRFYAVTYGLKHQSKRSDRAVMRFCGWWFCLLAIVISGVVCLDFTVDRDASKPFTWMLIIAVYTFWKATMAIINIIKAHKRKSPLLITLRNINCADAAMAILTLEHAMISTFGRGDGSGRFMMTMDGAVGAGAFLIVIGLGISMVTSRKINQ